MNKRITAAVAALGLAALLPLTQASGAGGIEADGDSTTACTKRTGGDCTRQTISADGARVVFTSEATNLVAGDGNEAADVFLATVGAGGTTALERVSVPDAAAGGTGGEAGGDSGTATISPNGEWVAFESEAANLVGGDLNGTSDVFVYHVATRRLVRASVPDPATGQAEADGASFSPSVADDGSVAFTSSASNLVAGAVPLSGFTAVYLRRASPAGTLIAAVGLGGLPADGASRHPSISADGTRLAFTSSASNLDGSEAFDHEDDVFVYTVGAGLSRVTADASAEFPALRPDGLAVVFISAAYDNDGHDDVFVANPDGSARAAVAECPCPPPSDGRVAAPAIAASGAVSFQSAAPLGTEVETSQVWLAPSGGAPTLASQRPGGPLPDDESEAASVSASGNRAVFTSAASNLIDGDGNDDRDVFVRDFTSGAVVRVSERPAAAPPPTTATTSPATITPFTAPPATAPAVGGTPVTTAPLPTATGYWMLDGDGNVYAFGAAKFLGSPADTLGSTHAADLEPTPSGNGYWIVDRRGRVYSYGDAPHFGNADRKVFVKDEKATSVSATPTGQGYWIFTSQGRAQAFGDALDHGDMSKVALNGPVLDSIPTSTGRGYYMVGSDGGIFAFGDARFHGSMGGKPLNAPVQSLVPSAGNTGYWLVASDGGVFAFGDAPFRGSMGGRPLNKPVAGMVPFGNGYLMVGEDGGIFNFSNLPFLGSLADQPPVEPMVAVAAR